MDPGQIRGKLQLGRCAFLPSLYRQVGVKHPQTQYGCLSMPFQKEAGKALPRHCAYLFYLGSQ